MTTRGDLNRINEAATFDPQQPPEEGAFNTRPCLTVAGVQIYAYVETVDLHDGPVLVVSVDYDTAGQSRSVTEFADDAAVLGWDAEKGIPTEVRIGPGLRVRVDRTGACSFHTEP
jgi:hypothetical protein